MAVHFLSTFLVYDPKPTETMVFVQSGLCMKETALLGILAGFMVSGCKGFGWLPTGKGFTWGSKDTCLLLRAFSSVGVRV